MSTRSDRYGHIMATMAKLDLLVKLSPIVESHEEYVHTLATIISMIDDYLSVLRRDLDALMFDADGGVS